MKLKLVSSSRQPKYALLKQLSEAHHAQLIPHWTNKNQNKLNLTFISFAPILCISPELDCSVLSVTSCFSIVCLTNCRLETSGGFDETIIIRPSQRTEKYEKSMNQFFFPYLNRRWVQRYIKTTLPKQWRNFVQNKPPQLLNLYWDFQYYRPFY